MSTTPCHLYRWLRYDDFATAYSGTDADIPDGLLYPRWAPKNYMARFKQKGQWVEQQRVSPADVRYDNQGRVKTGGGTSLFDCEGWFGFTAWHYFRIPKDTPVPPNLCVEGPGEEQTNASGARTGHHYQIEVRAPMTAAAMKGLLDNFLRSAIARNVELAHHA